MGSNRDVDGGLKYLKSTSKPPISRFDLIQAGVTTLDESLERLNNRYTKNSDKLAWARVISSLLSSIGSLLKDSELDDLIERVERLEKTRKESR